jgi:hypothetical protein
MPRRKKDDLVDLAYDLLVAIRAADRRWKDPHTGARFTTAFEESADGERYVSVSVHTRPRVTYVVDAHERTWKLVERRGRVDQYIWHRPNKGGDAGWVLTDERPPFDAKLN